MIFGRVTVVLAVLMACHCARAAPVEQPTSQPRDHAALIEALAHPDPQQRENAEKRLIELGRDARDDVQAATRSDDPAIAARARAVLRQLPWWLPGDPPQVRQALTAYGTSDEQGRRKVVTQLVAMGASGPLFRLLTEEPDGEIRWQIAGFMDEFSAPEWTARLRDIRPDTESAPIAYLAAKACWLSDRERAMALFRRVVELEPSSSWDSITGSFDAYEALISDAVDRADYAAAATYSRGQLGAQGSARMGAYTAARLLALHAYCGPIPGYTLDVAAAGELVGRPLFADRVALMYETAGLPTPPVLATWAHAASAMTIQMRSWNGMFFYRHQLLSAAEQEFSRIVAEVPPPVVAQRDNDLDDASPYLQISLIPNARMYLSRIAGALDHDFAAAEHLRLRAEFLARLNATPAGGNVARNLTGEPLDADLEAQMHWRYLRAARAAGDQKKVRKHLDVLKKLSPEDADIAIDLVPLLKDLGEAETSKKFFDMVYARLRAKVDADPDDPEALNNLAWLLSRTGERLPEALELATKAIKIAPDTAAFLDTAADANFRNGNADEAIRLETRALLQRPNDKFMLEQLARFKAGKK